MNNEKKRARGRKRKGQRERNDYFAMSTYKEN